MAHALGSLIAENIEAFPGQDAHGVLKRLQIEGNIGCDEIAVIFPGIGPCSYRIPQSLAFESMDEGRGRLATGGRKMTDRPGFRGALADVIEAVLDVLPAALLIALVISIIVNRMVPT